jgi:hypothetical protein
MTPQDLKPETDEIGSPYSGVKAPESTIKIHTWHPVHEDTCWWCQKQRELLSARWA